MHKDPVGTQLLLSLPPLEDDGMHSAQRPPLIASYTMPAHYRFASSTACPPAWGLVTCLQEVAPVGPQQRGIGGHNCGAR